jgi:phage tail protein X
MLTGVESLEYLAWRFYGRSTAWWHIADANPLIFPLDYRPGMSVTLPQSTGVGRVLRTRTF